MFFSKSTRKERRTTHRNRTLRLESLDRRELMDGYGLYSDLPILSGLVAEGEPPAAYSTQSSSVLVPGSVRNDSISQMGQVDRFTVQASAGQVFQVAIAPSGGLYAHLRVWAPDGRSLVNTASTSALAPQFTATAAGNYTVEVRGKDGRFVGPYRLGLESLSKPSADARVLVAGNVADGHLTGTIQADQYIVTAQAGDVFQVAMSSQSSLNASIRVFEPGGRVLVNTSTSGAVAPQFRADKAGQYVIQVQAHHLTSVGRYRVGVESLARPSTDIKSIATGAVANGQLTGTIQADQYRLTAVAGQRFQVALAPQGGLKASIRGFEPGGRVLVNTSTSGAVAPQFTADKAGHYIVQVQANNLTSLGAYRVGVESLSRPSADVKSLAIGTVANGQLTGTIQADQYRVTAVAGQRFQVALAPQGGLNASIRVFEPGGRVLVNTSTSTAVSTQFTATMAGQYLVLVQARNLVSTGNYRVGIESMNRPSPNAVSLPVGPWVNGQVTGTVQADQYKFSAVSGRKYSLDLTPLNGLNARIRVFEPSGRVIVNSTTSSARTFKFTANLTSELVVMVEAANGTSLGSYRLRLRLGW